MNLGSINQGRGLNLMSDIAFLVYSQINKGRRETDNSFDACSNAGAYVIIDKLQEAGFDVGFCTPESAHEHKIVLMSLASPYDVYHLIHAVGHNPKWKRKNKTFTTIAGGIGFTNPVAMRHFLDYGVFGRGEDIIVDLIKAIQSGKDFEHESVAYIPEITNRTEPVMFAQAKCLYPNVLKLYPTKFEEKAIGCLRRCNFCYYSWARKHLGNLEGYHSAVFNVGTKEVMFEDAAITASLFKNNVRTSLDGFSERLRFAFNKRISNDKIIEVIEQGSLITSAKYFVLVCYMIGSYPTESQVDYSDLFDTMSQCRPKGKKVLFYLHPTPFRPAPLTPSAYLPVNIWYNWNSRKSKIFCEKTNFSCEYTGYIEGSLQHLMDTIIFRSTEESDEIINRIVFDYNFRKKEVETKVESLAKTYDLSQYLKEYSTNERLPTWFLRSYTDPEVVKKIARKLKKDLGMPGIGNELSGLNEAEVNKILDDTDETKLKIPPSSNGKTAAFEAADSGSSPEGGAKEAGNANQP